MLEHLLYTDDIVAVDLELGDKEAVYKVFFGQYLVLQVPPGYQLGRQRNVL